MTIPSNSMRYGLSGFSFQPRGLLTSKIPLDTSGVASVNGFDIQGIEPSGSIRKAIFKIDDQYFYFLHESHRFLIGRD